MSELVWSDELGKRVRAGSWAEQAVSTVERIERAHAEARYEDAAELVEYFLEEARVCHAIYELWARGFVEWLAQAGVSDEERDAEVARLRALLAFPDGRAFEPAPAWERLRADAARLRDHVTLAGLDELRESWRQLHDRWVDFISGLLAFVARRFGEAALEPCYRHVLEPYVRERYMPYDVRARGYEETLWRNLYTTFEAMRGHLCGPGRRGDVEVTEDDDKWIVAFDPCGSGGRSLRGDPVEGTPPRPEPPYEFGVTTTPHDWAWNEVGVCHYCAHCCFALELLPAERWGHPVRVVDSPLYPRETAGPEARKCTWTIYKRLDAIPEEAYRRIGRTKPVAPAEAAFAAAAAGTIPSPHPPGE